MGPVSLSAYGWIGVLGPDKVFGFRAWFRGLVGGCGFGM